MRISPSKLSKVTSGPLILYREDMGSNLGICSSSQRIGSYNISELYFITGSEKMMPMWVDAGKRLVRDV